MSFQASSSPNQSSSSSASSSPSASGSTYQPDDAFQQAVQVMQATQDPERQHAATQKIKEYNKSPKFHGALMAIVLHGARFRIPVSVRQSAGLLIKNRLRHYSPQQQATVKKLGLALLADPERTVRSEQQEQHHTPCMCITFVAYCPSTSPKVWIECRLSCLLSARLVAGS